MRALPIVICVLLFGAILAQAADDRPASAVRGPASELSLQLLPEQRQVYVGQALRVDLLWDCRIAAKALKDLRLNPAFFEDPDIEIVIPRNTDDTEAQVGLPIGGRRVIGTRELLPEAPDALGTIRLPIYLRFAKPGTYELPATRLEVAVVSNARDPFGRYAAYFNNSLFEPIASGDHYERRSTESAPQRIEVRALPPDPEGSFAGWFEPMEVELSLGRETVEVGDLIDMSLKVSGHAPHGMWPQPNLAYQRALDARFLFDTNWTREWHAQGTVFRTRLRVLSTTVDAFPELDFQVFDPEAGSYAVWRTERIPLQVEPSDGRSFIPLKNFTGTTMLLTNNTNGIWHNLEKQPMNEILNTVVHWTREFFWLVLLAGPLVFVTLLPLMRERRRRAEDVRYRRRAEAYAAFRKIPENTPAKWSAFLNLLAAHFDADGNAWTRRDSEAALREIGADAAEIETLLAMHDAADAEDFSARRVPVQRGALNQVAKRVMTLAARNALLIGLLVSAGPQEMRADAWSDAQALFARAQSLGLGEAGVIVNYADAALQYEAAAQQGNRPGEALYNAGNAWFQAGEIGRAIAAYRKAEAFRPFDSRLWENLAAARALVLSEVPDERAFWEKLPRAWVELALLCSNFAFWIALLLVIRYSNRSSRVAVAITAFVLLLAAALLLLQAATEQVSGVVIVNSVAAKKGPGYAYADAFNESLREGVEFQLIEQREEWGRVELSDGRQCWLPLRLVETF